MVMVCLPLPSTSNRSPPYGPRVLRIVDCTARQALMLETIWPRPCDESVPVTVSYIVRATDPARLTLLQHDDRWGLASERHGKSVCRDDALRESMIATMITSRVLLLLWRSLPPSSSRVRREKARANQRAGPLASYLTMLRLGAATRLLYIAEPHLLSLIFSTSSLRPHHLPAGHQCSCISGRICRCWSRV